MAASRKILGEPGRHRTVIDNAKALLQRLEARDEARDGFPRLERGEELDPVAQLLQRLAQRMKRLRRSVGADHPPALPHFPREPVEKGLQGRGNRLLKQALSRLSS